MTTREKILSLVAELERTPADSVAPEARDLIDVLTMVRGFGVDPIAFLIPNSDAEADLFVDKAIALLLQVRGDDLPPFDLARYGEAPADAEPPA